MERNELQLAVRLYAMSVSAGRIRVSDTAARSRRSSRCSWCAPHWKRRPGRRSPPNVTGEERVLGIGFLGDGYVCALRGDDQSAAVIVERASRGDLDRAGDTAFLIGRARRLLYCHTLNDLRGEDVEFNFAAAAAGGGRQAIMATWVYSDGRPRTLTLLPRPLFRSMNGGRAQIHLDSACGSLAGCADPTRRRREGSRSALRSTL